MMPEIIGAIVFCLTDYLQCARTVIFISGHDAYARQDVKEVCSEQPELKMKKAASR